MKRNVQSRTPISSTRQQQIKHHAPTANTFLKMSLDDVNGTNGSNGINGYHTNGAINNISNKGDDFSDKKKPKSSLPPVPPDAHRIVLMRHGESEFNNANIFTGWCDVALTPRGIVEAEEAGQVFASHSIIFRKCYASLLTRSIATAHRSLEAAGVAYTPLRYDWRLNERHYGALQGLSKDRTADRLGRARVMKWRRSYEARPPPMTEDHPHYDMIQYDARYRHLHGMGGIPLAESLQECQSRVVEAWEDIIREIQNSEDDLNNDAGYTLLVAHANTLRALVMHLDDIPSGEIEGLNIPTAIPFYYDICTSTGKVVFGEDGVSHVNGGMDSEQPPVGLGKFRGKYIDDERKKRNFLERRRAANDPWLWALHDEQVAPSMLVGRDEDVGAEEGEGLVGVEEEAARNTEIFARLRSNR